jgi:hypothetical protein
MERGRSARRTNHPAMRSGLKKLLIASLYGEQKKHIFMEADLSLFLIRLSIQHLLSWYLLCGVPRTHLASFESP